MRPWSGVGCGFRKRLGPRLDGAKGVDVHVFSDPGVDTIVGYEKGEDIDLSALHVTMSNVTILSDRIVVDLAGNQDLTIMMSTKSFSSSDLIFESAAATATATATASAFAGSIDQSWASHGPLWSSSQHKPDHLLAWA